MPMKTSDTTNDQGKFIQDKLINLAEQQHKMPMFADEVSMPSGDGKTAYFVKYNRVDIPVDRLQEGVTPAETPMTIGTQNVTVEHWGMFIGLTDVVTVTTKHPILNKALELVADAMARVEDYTIAEVLNATATNKQFWDGSRADRAAITTTDVFKSSILIKANVTLSDGGAKPFKDNLYACLYGMNVEGDIRGDATAVGGWTAVHQYSGNIDEVKKGAIGVWLGFIHYKSNFLPKWSRLTSSASIAATTGGSLSGTVYTKVTRKSLQRGFEEAIAVEVTNTMSTNTRLAFTAPATSGYVYNIYAGSTTGDANLFLAKENLAASGVYNLDSVPSGTSNPPTTPGSGVTVYPMYCFGQEAIDWVMLNELNVKSLITPKAASDSDPLAQRRKVGSKWTAKAGIRSQFNVLVIELASNFA